LHSGFVLDAFANDVIWDWVCVCVCVGAGFKGQLGNNNNSTEYHTPVHTPALNSVGREIVDICCGNHTTIMLLGKYQPRSLKYLAAQTIRKHESVMTKLVRMSTILNEAPPATNNAASKNKNKNNTGNSSLGSASASGSSSSSRMMIDSDVTAAQDVDEERMYGDSGLNVIDDDLYDYILTV
jgi:hypothetical protein